MRKQEIIKEAKELVDKTNWKETGDEFKALLAKWKEAGSAGRDNENRLWDEFNEHYQAFLTKRNAFFDELHEKQKGAAEKKQELIAKAKEILEIGRAHV